MLVTTVLSLLPVSFVPQGPGSSCPPYFQGLGDLPGDTFLSFATDLTADGRVVIGGSNADDPDVDNDGDSAAWQHANQGFRWFSPCTGAAQAPEGFGYPFTGVHPESNLVGVSPDGRLYVGSGTYGPSVPTVFRPVLWSAPGVFLELGRLGGHASGSAWDVSDRSVAILGVPGSGHDRRLAVGYSTTAANHAHRVPGAVPVYWPLPSTTPVPLPLPEGVSATFGEARAVSRDGRVIAGNLYEFGSTLTSTACAWLWHPQRGGRFEAFALGIPAGRASSWIGGLSADGTTITGYGLDDVNDFGVETPCVWRRSGPMPTATFGDPQVLPMLSGASGASASGVSANGQVLGGQCVVDFGLHAVRWSGPDYSVLEDVLVTAAAHGLDTGSWTLWYASGLSADGETLIGTGDRIDENDEFVIEGWAAQLPLP